MSLSTHRVGHCFHQGLWEMNLTLFLLLALTASWTGLVQCEDNEETEQVTVLEDLPVSVSFQAEGEEEENHGEGAGSGDGRSRVAAISDLGSPPNSESNTEQTDTKEEIKPTTETNTDADTEDPDPVIMIIIPLVLTLVIIAVIVCVVMFYRRWRIKVAEDTNEDPYLDHGDHEKVPMPMFDDDIPSVMELEMEDLENWMTKGTISGPDAVFSSFLMYPHIQCCTDYMLRYP